MTRPLGEFPHCPRAWYSSDEDSRERKRPRISESTPTPIAPPLAFVNPPVEASIPAEEAPAEEEPAVKDQAFPESPQASQGTQAYADRLVLAFDYLEEGEEPPPVEEDSQASEDNDFEDFDAVALLAAYEAHIQQIKDHHATLAATKTVVPEIASRASRADTESLPEASGGASPGPESLTGSRPRASSLEVGRSALQEEQQSKISKPPTPSRPPFEYTGNPEESDTESDTTILDEPDTPQSAKARSKAPATPQKAQKASADSPSMPPRRGRASAAYKITSIEQMREILQLTGRDDVYRALRVLEEVSLAELAKVAMKCVPKVADGLPPRVIRAFYGAMSNGPPRMAGAAYALNPENVRIGDAEELEAWLKTSEAKPLRLCAVLHRPRALLAGPRQRPETPPPDGWEDLDEHNFQKIEVDKEEQMLTFIDKRRHRWRQNDVEGEGDDDEDDDDAKCRICLPYLFGERYTSAQENAEFSARQAFG
ncbi:hypothetical protein P167DRAFT_550583 [Morchella conica CCBAS932]|uniref:Uncharacterized protein n=1 Tax=Morchella conica CCBAS932 TaxID=1392247 RepID=A0A3N4K7H5_9PEZI|nr:hypothetical protein P167DRAFT_550583 [Morchella conica CCBAS932]